MVTRMETNATGGMTPLALARLQGEPVKALRFVVFLTLCCAAGCLSDPDGVNVEVDEDGVLVSVPDAGAPTTNVGGGECLPEEAERGTCQGGGGGGTGGGTGDEPPPRCLVPGWVWWPALGRCAPPPGSSCGRTAGGECHINILGQCDCPSSNPIPPPPPLLASEQV